MFEYRKFSNKSSNFLLYLGLYFAYQELSTSLRSEGKKWRKGMNRSGGLILDTPVTVAERSKSCTVFALSEAGIVG
jgi:hypothetical protein